jgi:hypothetical protein
MQAIDLGSRRQRYLVVVLAGLYPALWLVALTKILGSQFLARWALLPATAIFVISAVGTLATARAGASTAGRPAWSRLGVYLAWGWLIPYCVISLGAIAAFEYLWPAFGVLVLPALLFLALPLAREQFLAVAFVSVATAGLYLLLAIDASVLWTSKLTIAMAVSAGPFWTLAAYLGLYEHLVQARTDTSGAKREPWIALASALLGVLLFFALIAGVVMLAVSSLQ